jgi:hypothetical protein
MADVTLDFLAEQQRRILDELRAARGERDGLREAMTLGFDTLAAKADLTRKVLERKIDLLRLELLDEASTMAKLEARGGDVPLAHRLDELAARLAELERRLDAPAGE